MLLKVGRTLRGTKRWKELQTGNGSKLEVVGWIRGSHKEENAIHDSLVDQHVRGEWFHVSEEQVLAIAEVCEEDERRVLVVQLEASAKVLTISQSD